RQLTMGHRELQRGLLTFNDSAIRRKNQIAERIIMKSECIRPGRAGAVPRCGVPGLPRVVARWGAVAGGAGVVVASVLAAGAPPAEAASYPTGGYQVAMQASTGHLFAYDPQDNAHEDANLGMGAGSSPSVAPGPEMAFQASTGHLYLYHPADKVSRDVGLGMAAGTSPAIDVQPGDGYEVAFQANTGHLFVYDTSGNKVTDSGLGMAAGTSPSVADGTEVAFQASTGHLYLYHPADNVSRDVGLGMAARPSPS